MIDAFRHYLSRERSILESIKTSSMEFLRITNDLIKKSAFQEKDRDYKIAGIKKEVANMSNNRFGIKLWLLEKVNVL